MPPVLGIMAQKPQRLPSGEPRKGHVGMPSHHSVSPAPIQPEPPSSPPDATTPASSPPAAHTAMLSPAHVTMLRQESGITDEVIKARGYRSIDDPADLQDLGFSKAQARTAPVLAIPLWDVHGQHVSWQIRPGVEVA